MQKVGSWRVRMARPTRGVEWMERAGDAPPEPGVVVERERRVVAKARLRVGAERRRRIGSQLPVVVPEPVDLGAGDPLEPVLLGGEHPGHRVSTVARVQAQLDAVVAKAAQEGHEAWLPDVVGHVEQVGAPIEPGGRREEERRAEPAARFRRDERFERPGIAPRIPPQVATFFQGRPKQRPWRPTQSPRPAEKPGMRVAIGVVDVVAEPDRGSPPSRPQWPCDDAQPLGRQRREEHRVPVDDRALAEPVAGGNAAAEGQAAVPIERCRARCRGEAGR